MDNLRELYQHVIVDHNKNPRNFHIMDHPSHQAEGFNPLCGDKVQVYLLIDANNLITDVSFQGNGCAISMASASLMTEALKGKAIQEADMFFENFHDLITSDKNIDVASLGKLAVLSGVKEYPTRVKCATLAWHTVHAAMHNNSNKVSTE